MGYFKTKEGILAGDQQADIIDKEVKNMSFEEVIKNKEMCARLYKDVKPGFMGREMTKTEFVGHLAFCTCKND